ncbi:Gfo/Idh/MocA family oxidoreductase [Paraburkholderia sp. Ac-20342]|uniref:Gfo/Idh/MocA family protein n=1 Tax=Paraburkholderia sp. Ac-20342 TaxID=2703889 RepID=UPI00197D91C6|nr:Gfo/Idh/MocA family oxidoreductase [Paraburkholderia sp. Ac-20342]MBN3849604.1 Gfo/Idh/MocA family oxidoreductase [Paraburkholderia sp. Ac-20342]
MTSKASDLKASVLNAAIVGCGWVADWHIDDGLAHLKDRFRVLVSCDKDIERARSFALKHDVPRVSGDLEQVLAMPDVDVVIICTPPSLHYPMIMACLKHGKHVVCEKPFVASLAEVDAVIEAEKVSSARVMPIFQYRFGDGLAKVRHVIQSGLAGRHFVSSIDTAKRRDADYYQVAWRGKFATELGGVLLTQSIHIHDVLMWLIGPVKAAACFKTTRVNPIEVEDCAVASLQMLDGSLASLSATLGSARQVTRLRLCFENVTFEKVGYDENSSRPGDDPWTVIPRKPELQDAIEKKMAELSPASKWFARQYELFHDALESGASFPVTLSDARASIELVTALFMSNDTHTVVDFPIGPSHPKYHGWFER